MDVKVLLREAHTIVDTMRDELNGLSVAMDYSIAELVVIHVLDNMDRQVVLMQRLLDKEREASC